MKIRIGLAAYDHIQPAAETHHYLMDMLQQTITSKDGQEGLTAFRKTGQANAVQAGSLCYVVKNLKNYFSRKSMTI